MAALAPDREGRLLAETSSTILLLHLQGRQGSLPTHCCRSDFWKAGVQFLVCESRRLAQPTRLNAPSTGWILDFIMLRRYVLLVGNRAFNGLCRPDFYRAKKGNMQKNTIVCLSRIPNLRSSKYHLNDGLAGLVTGSPSLKIG